MVMASGDSARFGGGKLLADFCGGPLLRRVLEALPAELFTVVVTRQAEIADLARGMGRQALLHAEPDISDTIRLGLSELKAHDGCLFCVGDQPLLERASVERLLQAFAMRPERVVRLAYGERLGNPALFPKSLFPELLRLEPSQSGGAVMKRHPELVDSVQARREAELMDVDTPEQLKDLEALAMQRDKVD